MYKLAFMGSGTGRVFEAAVKYFKDKDVEIFCISDELNSDILERAKSLGVKSKYLPTDETAGYLGAADFDLIALTDYKPELTSEIISLGKFINVHPSLLPAFKGHDAISRAFDDGVKVSGVTVHYVSEDVDECKILAQYPVLIDNLTHFDEFKEHIYRLEELLYPIVLDKVLKDEVFDFQDLLSPHSCGGSCGECGGCH